MTSNSLYDEKHNPRIKLIAKTKIVEHNAKSTTVKNFDRMNSLLLKPSIRFCFKVP